MTCRKIHPVFFRQQPENYTLKLWSWRKKAKTGRNLSLLRLSGCTQTAVKCQKQHYWPGTKPCAKQCKSRPRRIQDFCLFILQWSVFQSGLQIAERPPSAAALHRHVNASVSDHWPAIHSSSLSIKDFALHIIFHFISERSSLESFDMRACVLGSMKKNVWGPPWIPEWLDAWSPFDSMRVSESERMGASQLSVRQHKVPPSSSSKWDKIHKAEMKAKRSYNFNWARLSLHGNLSRFCPWWPLRSDGRGETG